MALGWGGRQEGPPLSAAQPRVADALSYHCWAGLADGARGQLRIFRAEDSELTYMFSFVDLTYELTVKSSGQTGKCCPRQGSPLVAGRWPSSLAAAG